MEAKLRSAIEQIILDGTRAPSGENCQPWRFEVFDNSIRIYNVPEADVSIYNFAQRGSYVAHGALIENIFLSARKHGFETQVEVFPDSTQSNLVSIISLTSSEPVEEKLYPYIAARVTNRKKHHLKKIPQSDKEKLLAAAQKIGDAELRIIDDAGVLQKLGPMLAINEEILFENKSLHDFFYSHLLWKENEQDTRSGFYFKTLEFLPPQIPAIKLLKNWRILKILNKTLGISKQIAKENAQKYASSGALAAVLVSDNSPTDFVRAGRATERAWLTATELGLAVHPCTGPLYFMENIEGGNAQVFSAAHQRLIEAAYTAIMQAFDAEGMTMPMLFRVGYADVPSAQATRMPPKISFRS